MSGFNAIDLGKLPAPDVVEALDFEAVLAAMRNDLIARDPEFDALLESDPAIKVLQVAAYRETKLRGRVNDAAKAVMLATAGGADLENLAAWYGVKRQLIDAGDPDARPPVAPTYESDTRLRRRAALALEGFSTAGPAGAYLFHALSADPKVKDVNATSPNPGEVVVTVLSTEAGGVPDQELLDKVKAVLTHEDVRPLTDRVTVKAAQIDAYKLKAKLTISSGPDAEVVKRAAALSVQAHVAARHILGGAVSISGLHSALHVEGVTKVVIETPDGDLNPGADSASYCEDITLEAVHG